ncbi:MAG: LytTR family transcriptional regulator DNA-binding domain-containing protein [Chitinophagales bacterium]|nr:LytTR family transcriptional regulator DNA-binding domain-containing protein [Chitinophagales bacterium]
MKSILIDDETDALEALHLLLMETCPEVVIAGKFTDPEKGLAAIRNMKPDLVFLDIEMPVMNGFQLLEALEIPAFSLVFVTAYDQFAVKAFRFSAVDYLLKPVDPVELRKAVDKAADKHRVGKSQLDWLKQSLTQQDSRRFDKIALPSAQGYTFVELTDVMYCESDSSYTKFFLANGDTYLITKSLGEVEEMLAGTDFFRIHKQFLVNMRHIRSYIRGDGGYVIMPDKVNIPVSRIKKEEFTERFTRF